jgi:YHS domain-containing protein
VSQENVELVLGLYPPPGVDYVQLFGDDSRWVVQAEAMAPFVHAGFEWNYTAVLNIIFIGVLVLLYWLARNRTRLGGGDGYALDPVCGMQVRTADAPVTRHDGERSYWFCSDHCADRFDRSLGSRHG